MKLNWFGQSCFLLASSAGTRVLMDPFNKWFGYKVPRVEADVVTTSHSHKDHNYIQAVKGNFHHLDQPDSYTHKDIVITGTLTYHDKSLGAKRGKNVIYVFSLDGIRVCHCGDLGHLLSTDQLNQIGQVDLLLLPVGGSFAISVAEAQEVRKQVHPAITVPMHYRTPAMGLGGLFFARVDEFLLVAGEIARKVSELSLDPSTIADYAGIVLMAYQ
jgi:L-ascorbate metabolism protein UlaG (beta-lactamase superfamily)